MNYYEFRNKFFELACFSNDQILIFYPGFDRNNLTRWTMKGYLIRLRQGFYTFPEYKSIPGYGLFFANRIYKPSYISLHSALSFFGIIPESVVQVTSITTLKTAMFTNQLAEYSYKSVKTELMFGYQLKEIGGGKSFQIALPEKALLDLLYLYPEYQSSQDFEDLRLDVDFLNDDLNIKLLLEFAARFKSKVLDHKISKLLKVYHICW